MLCGNESCQKKITEKSEAEYSEWLNEIFCCPDCAKEVYFDKMRSHPLLGEDLKQFIKKREEDLKCK